MANYQNIFAVIGALYGLALIIVKITPTPKDDAELAQVGIFLTALAKVFGLDLKQGINLPDKTGAAPGASSGTASTVGKALALFFIFSMLVGCAGIAKMTPQERSRTFCADFMAQYESLHAQSLAILADETASVDTKVMIATKINPKLNRLKPLIVDYCKMATAGGASSSDTITAMISDITALLVTANQKGTKS